MRLVGALCCEQNDERAAKGNFMDAGKMKEPTVRDDKAQPSLEETGRMVRLVEEAFERALKAA